MTRARLRGFTILELTIVFSIFLIIGIVVANLFTHGSAVYRHSEGHIEMQRTGRLAIARMTPYVSSMFDGDLPLELPIIQPPSEPDAESDRLIFRSTEDWLGNGYPSPQTSSLYVQSHDEIEGLTFLYQIRYQAPVGAGERGEILLEKLNYDQATFDAANPATYPVISSKSLYRLKDNEAINEFVFKRLRATVVTLDFKLNTTVKSEVKSPVDVTEDFRATFNLPCSSM